jgi:hypothetical protein
MFPAVGVLCNRVAAHHLLLITANPKSVSRKVRVCASGLKKEIVVFSEADSSARRFTARKNRQSIASLLYNRRVCG